jgi:hypothetical protein
MVCIRVIATVLLMGHIGCTNPLGNSVSARVVLLNSDSNVLYDHLADQIIETNDAWLKIPARTFSEPYRVSLRRGGSAACPSGGVVLTSSQFDILSDSGAVLPISAVANSFEVAAKIPKISDFISGSTGSDHQIALSLLSRTTSTAQLVIGDKLDCSGDLSSGDAACSTSIKDTAMDFAACAVANEIVASLVKKPDLQPISEAQQFISSVTSVDLTLQNSGAEATECRIAPDLPPGLQLSVQGGSCRISGTPEAASGRTTYRISAISVYGEESEASVTIEVVIDTSAPDAAGSLRWVQSSPYAVTSITAAWTKSIAGDLSNQKIQFYTGASCNTESGSLIDLASASAQTRAFTGIDGTTYTYKITSIDAAGNSTESSCSSALAIDTSAPSAATPLSWSQSSPYAGTSVTAAWTKSDDDEDLSNQKIQFYTGASCNTESGSLIDLASASTQTRAFTGVDGTTYTYKVTSFDAAGNSTVSACSSVLSIDTTAPAAATSLGWSQSTPSSVGTVTAAWTKSVASDLSNQTIQFYADGSCSSASGGAIDLSSAVTETRSFAGSNGTYTYKITSIDNAGNPSVSACSSAMVINVLTCPTNYVKIPAYDANSDGDLVDEYDTAEFCVMKYEAKVFNVTDNVAVDNGSASLNGAKTYRPDSRPDGTPWVNIQRGTDGTIPNSAWKGCKDLGAYYDLLTNAQWQAIARNAETVSSNWSNGNSSASDSLNRGNSNNSGSLSADASDTNGCVGITSNGDPADNCGNAWHVNKRTHTLSNGEVIWDIAGNVEEWVQDNYTNQGGDNYVSQLTSTAGYNLLRWGPSGNYTAKNSGEHGGLGFAFLSYSGGAVLRGGHHVDYLSNPRAGIFSSKLIHSSTDTGFGSGFRCAYSP